MKYAVIKIGGSQYKVEEGQIIEVELLESSDKTFVFDQVLLAVDGDKVELGLPTVAGLKVYGELIADIKGKKIEVLKYKSKSRYRKHTGHRQKYTQLKITGIGTQPVVKKPAVTVSTRSSKSVAGKKPVVKKPAVKKNC